MNNTEKKVKEFVLKKIGNRAKQAGILPEDIGDNYNLIESGLIDSFSFLELLSDIEAEFNCHLNFSDVDPEKFTVFRGLISSCAERINEEK